MHCRQLKRLPQAAALLLLVSCSRSGPVVDRQALLAIPMPDLGGAEPGVHEQIGERRANLEALLEQTDVGAEELAEAFGQLGFVFVTYDFLDAAQVCFLNARHLQPEDFRWTYLIGYLHKAEGRPAEAIPLFERALELRPDFPPAALRLGRAHLELGDYTRARALFEKAHADHPQAAAAVEGLGKVASAAEDYAAAVEYLERALELDPAATSLHYALGQAYRKLGDLERARSHLEQSGDVAVAIPDPVISPLAQLGQSSQFYLVQGGEALSDQNYEAAVAAYRRALEHNSGSFKAYKGLAYALEKIGDTEGAIVELEAALQHGDSGEEDKDRKARAETHQILGGLMVLAGHEREALEHFTSSLELDPDQPGVRLKLANALARGGRFEEAVDQYGLVLESSPEHASTILARRATALVNLGRKQDAIADFELAVEADPQDSQLRLRFAEALEFLHEPKRAAEQRAAATRLASEGEEQIRLRTETARQQTRQGDFEAAVASYRRALEVDPERSDVRYQLASVLGHLQRYDEALSEFERVIEAAPRHAAARRGEITVLLLQARYGEARVRLNEAVRLFPRDGQLAHIQARLLATAPDPRVRDGRLGLEIAQRLFNDKKDLRVRETLAMAYAEAGLFGQAVDLQRDLVAEAERSGRTALVEDLRAELHAFERRQAWWASSPEEILAATLGAPPGS